MEFLDEPQHSLNAVFMRGGTSKAVFFRRSELPPAPQPHDNPAWNIIFCGVLGSPDANGRQLDGLGGGVTSLSKVAIIDASDRPDADVDFTFAQVGVRDGIVGYKGNCGNISAAVACYAVDEGLVPINGSRAGVRIFNTNTRKMIHATVPLMGKRAAIVNDAQFAREPESGVELRFLDPGGAATGQLLPTGNIRDTLSVRGLGPIEASCVDAANPTVFILAAALGLTGREAPSALEANPDAMRQFESVRIAAAIAMGLATEAQLSALKNLPLVSLISPQAPGERAMIHTRMVSAGQPHRAIPLTGAMCLAIAAQLPGSIVADALQAGTGAQLPLLCIGHAAGEMTVAAKVVAHGASYRATEATVYRTARRLMEGRVLYPAKA
jgi:2-methylaconitate isomerase